MNLYSSGMFDYFAAHQNQAAHDRLHPAACGLLEAHGLGEDHVPAKHLEHVVDQHSQAEKCTVHLESSRRQPLHVHLGLELGVILLTGAPIAVDAKNLPLRQIESGPGRENRYLGRQQRTPLLFGRLCDLEDKPDRVGETLHLFVDAPSVNCLGLAALMQLLGFFAGILPGRLQPRLILYPALIVLDDQVGVFSLNQTPDHILAVEAAVGDQQKRILHHGATEFQALVNEIPSRSIQV